MNPALFDDIRMLLVDLCVQSLKGYVKSEFDLLCLLIENINYIWENVKKGSELLILKLTFLVHKSIRNLNLLRDKETYGRQTNIVQFYI
mgnify:CR=1 FL=1